MPPLTRVLVHRSLVLVLLAAALFVPTTGLVAQEGACDPDIERNTRDRPHDYRFRGDRCEGIYASDVSGQALWLASFTEQFEPYAFDFQPLTVRWSAPPASVVHLRGHGIRQGLFYRMDSERPAGSNAYEWNSELLAAREITRDDLGLLAWTEAEQGVDLFVPVRVTQGAAPTPAERSYELVVVPNVRLSEVYVTLARVEAPGERPAGVLLRNRDRLDQRLYATQRPIRIPIADPGEGGTYYVEITGVRADGGSAPLDPIWFYHPGS